MCALQQRRTAVADCLEVKLQIKSINQITWYYITRTVRRPSYYWEKDERKRPGRSYHVNIIIINITDPQKTHAAFIFAIANAVPPDH